MCEPADHCHPPLLTRLPGRQEHDPQNALNHAFFAYQCGKSCAITRHAARRLVNDALRVVVAVVDLACLDCLIWLRTGEQAAAKLALSQSTISRKSNRAIDALRIRLTRDNGEWKIDGDTELLEMARKLHQHQRWKFDLDLRLDAQYYSGPVLCDPPPRRWMLGNFEFMEVHSPLHLLRQGVLDAWIGVFPDTPAEDDPELICYHLHRMPTHLVVAEGHPLLSLGRAPTFEDLQHYPSLSLPDNAFPKIQAALQKLGLWNSPSRISRYKQELWEGRTLDQLTIGYASVFTLHLFDLPQVIVPLPLDLEVGDSLVVRRQYADHPRTLELLSQLRARSKQLAQQWPDIRVL